MVWQSTVAIAAPFTPRPSPKMKMGSSMALDMTVNSVRPMASLGLPVARIIPFSPKYRWEMMNPARIMTI